MHDCKKSNFSTLPNNFSAYTHSISNIIITHFSQYYSSGIFTSSLKIIFLTNLSHLNYISKLQDHHLHSDNNHISRCPLPAVLAHQLLGAPCILNLVTKKTGKCLSTEYTPSHAASHVCTRLSHTHTRHTVYTRRQTTQV